MFLVLELIRICRIEEIAPPDIHASVPGVVFRVKARVPEEERIPSALLPATRCQCQEISNSLRGLLPVAELIIDVFDVDDRDGKALLFPERLQLSNAVDESVLGEDHKVC